MAGVGQFDAGGGVFGAGMQPLAAASRRGQGGVKRLDQGIRQVLTEAIRAGGSWISDYVDSDGREGSFQFEHRVYQRTGQRCGTCGTRLKRILALQLAPHFGTKWTKK